MKVLVATEKPFAAAAVNGIKAEIEAAGNELVLLEKYTERLSSWQPLLMPTHSLSVAIRWMLRYSTLLSS